MFPGTILMGAQARLLPPSLPFRFFLIAIGFHMGAWIAIGLAAETVAGFRGGPGAPLAAVHVLTLGVFTAAAMGATAQLLPVATGLAHRSLWPVRLVWWSYLPGMLLLISGFALVNDVMMVAGAFLLALAMLVFAALVGDMLRRTTTLRIPVRFAWGALASLVVLVVMGVMLVANFHHGFLGGNHMGFATAHLILALFGYMGLFSMGFSNILVPMFALSNHPPEAGAKASLALALTAVVLGVAGALAGFSWVLAAAALLGLGAVAAHVHGMWTCMRSGMRKNLGLSFVLVKAAWAMLALGLLFGALAAMGWLGDTGPALFGFVVLFGWLLTFLLGMLQRILPFLAAMNMSKGGAKPPRLSELADARVLKIHAACHGGALVAVGVGIALDNVLMIETGAVLGLAGSVCFTWFAGMVLRGYLAYHRAADAASRSPST